MAKQEAAATNGKAEEVTDVEEVKPHKAEGSLTTIKVMELQNNPNRSDDVFVWLDDKITGLQETYAVDGFQSTFEVTADKAGRFCLSGGGHHRTEALRRMIKEGNGDKVRGLFKDADGDFCIKVVKKNYTKEQMLRNFMIENADAWGKDSDQNVYLMVYQVKDFLDKMLVQSADVDDFVGLVNSAHPIKMDKRSYSAAKNKGGTGASTICQYLGEHTYDRARIQMAVQLINGEGKDAEVLRELAKKLPSISMVYKIRNMMTTTEEDGAKVRNPEDIKAAEKIVENHGLSYQDLREVDTFAKERLDEGISESPIDALRAFATKRTEDLKKSKEEIAAEKKAKAEAPSKATGTAAEQCIESLKNALMTCRLAISEGNLSKAQVVEATSLYNDLNAEIKTMNDKFGKGNSKKK